MTFDDLPIPDDADTVTQRILDGILAEIPGFVAYDGAPEVVLAQEIGFETVLTNTRMQLVLQLAVAGIGQTVFGVPVDLGTPATLVAAVVVTTVGDVIPAGFTVIGTDPIGNRVAFSVPAAITTTGLTTSVTFTATDVGTDWNGVPSGQALAIATSTLGVVSATVTTASAGGVDPETLVTYLDRLTDYLAILKPGGVLAADLAALARTVTGVQRAIGVDLLDGFSFATNVERTATVFVVDAAGAPVTAAVRADVYDLIEDRREPNFVCYVNDPAYTALTVAVTVVADAGADSTAVHDAVVAALGDYLDPATWGATDAAHDRDWASSQTVSRTQLLVVASRVAGVAAVTALTINGTTDDVTLAGPVGLPAPLSATAWAPTPSAITATVLS